ncbi:Uu.00g031180.m01.CDS01 [Anthostomella pinea]|uniref:Uu.00g031180.m01.CDS01 n=1 Tax=Anthostomella pinea TaxID=933095 RepID=A0AAI8YD10_9PEZI|nr:Uu.00g031180.m01.CDS01 [Anthostomella pinea]
MNMIISNIGDGSLTAKKSLSNGNQGPLADNQWQLDVQNWYGISMAVLQKSFVNAAVGPADAALRSFVTAPNATEEKTMCNSQKIRSSAYSSFSLCGLLFVFLCGGLIMAISWILEPLFTFLEKRFKLLSQYARLEWAVNSALQMQRLAHEQLGAGSWTRGAESVPLTEADAELGVLDLADEKHPRLMRPVPLVTAGAKGGNGTSRKSSELPKYETTPKSVIEKTATLPSPTLSLSLEAHLDWTLMWWDEGVRGELSYDDEL